MEPRIVSRKGFKVVGLKYYGSDPANNCPGIWQEFNRRHIEISNRVDDRLAYGLICTGEKDMTGGNFDYIACMEASDFADTPDGMVEAVVPDATYAAFTHRGSLDRLSKTYEEIFDRCFPESKYRPVGSNNSELYDSRFNMGSDSEFDIYVSLEKN